MTTFYNSLPRDSHGFLNGCIGQHCCLETGTALQVTAVPYSRARPCTRMYAFPPILLTAQPRLLRSRSRRSLPAQRRPSCRQQSQGGLPGAADAAGGARPHARGRVASPRGARARCTVGSGSSWRRVGRGRGRCPSHRGRRAGPERLGPAWAGRWRLRRLLRAGYEGRADPRERHSARSWGAVGMKDRLADLAEVRAAGAAMAAGCNGRGGARGPGRRGSATGASPGRELGLRGSGRARRLLPALRCGWDCCAGRSCGCPRCALEACSEQCVSSALRRFYFARVYKMEAWRVYLFPSFPLFVSWKRCSEKENGVVGGRCSDASHRQDVACFKWKFSCMVFHFFFFSLIWE